MDYYKLLTDYMNRDVAYEYEILNWEDRGTTIEITYKFNEWEYSNEKMNIPLFDLLTFVYSKS